MNQAINFFWTIICMLPVVVFWTAAGVSPYAYIFLGLSCIALLVPARVLQISPRPRFYEALGVKTIRKLVQNGDLANRVMRNRDAGYKLVSGRQGAASYMRTIVMYERYHWFCLVFYILTSVYACLTGYYVLAFFIFLANLIYNICPILLQQYNRARVLLIKGR